MQKNMEKKGFTLVELLVVIAIIALLLSILMPSLSRARAQAQEIVCRSNVRQISLANEGYASENGDYYVRAAYDMFDKSGGKNRWHGVRLSSGLSSNPSLNTFDPKKGPLASYLADGKIKKCPAMVNKFETKGSKSAYESGCGGFGYNSVGIGSRTYKYGPGDQAMRSSMKNSEISNASQKVMFAETAMIQGYPSQYLIEYSFCEPRFLVEMVEGIPTESDDRPTPSIHFRHRGKSDIVFVDGHVGSMPLSFSSHRSDVLRKFTIGWFGPDDNSMFKP